MARVKKTPSASQWYGYILIGARDSRVFITRMQIKLNLPFIHACMNLTNVTLCNIIRKARELVKDILEYTLMIFVTTI
jgi:hypothetical protein